MTIWKIFAHLEDEELIPDNRLFTGYNVRFWNLNPQKKKESSMTKIPNDTKFQLNFFAPLSHWNAHSTRYTASVSSIRISVHTLLLISRLMSDDSMEKRGKRMNFAHVTLAKLLIEMNNLFLKGKSLNLCLVISSVIRRYTFYRRAKKKKILLSKWEREMCFYRNAISHRLLNENQQQMRSKKNNFA